jgi:hypothetical protein
MRNYYGLIRAERISPPVASRVLAYAAVGLYEGLATGSPELRSLAGQLNGLDSLPHPDPNRRYDPVLVAQADAFIAIWHEKYRTNSIRPVTYIRRYIDPAWTPAIITPPFPEYPSGHSGQSAAAATVLTALLGPVAFDDSTNLALGHAPRRYASFQAAADEAAESRLYGGIHFPMGNENGKVLGRCVGQVVLARLRTRAGPDR